MSDKYCRNCPSCGKLIEHKTKYSRNQCEKNNRPCRSCSGKSKYKKFGSNIDVINQEVKSGLRKNGFQDKKHSDKSKKLMSENRLNYAITHNLKIHNNESEKNHNVYRTIEHRNKMSELTKGNKNGMFNRKFFDIWILKYGIEEANKLEHERRRKLSIKNSGINNPMYGKEAPHKSGKGISGWYKSFYFRSLHELKFILVCERFKIEIISAENIKINYVSYTGNERTYSPDYLIVNKYLIEVKPQRLQKTPLNILKFKAANEYCKNNSLKFKILDFGTLSQDELNRLIANDLVKITKWM